MHLTKCSQLCLGNNLASSDDTLSRLAHLQPEDKASVAARRNLVLFDDVTLQKAFTLQESRRPLPTVWPAYGHNGLLEC